MSDPTASQQLQLWRRLIIFLLLVWIVAFGIVLLLQIRPGLPHLALLLLCPALLGLVSGLGTRLLLKELHWTLGSLATLAALFSGLFLLGAATGWRYGLGPQEFKAFDLAGAAQVVTGLLASLFAATAWRKPALQDRGPAFIPAPQPQQPATPPETQPGKPRAVSRPKKTAGSQSGARAKKAAAMAVPKSAPPKQSPPALPPKPRFRRRNKRPEVQFVSSQEHRCPYCLEIVQPQDPRGIVECKICHALHHADCWAITGTCQVPHLNA
jgi:hypothetical protein